MSSACLGASIHLLLRKSRGLWFEIWDWGLGFRVVGFIVCHAARTASGHRQGLVLVAARCCPGQWYCSSLLFLLRFPRKQ